MPLNDDDDDDDDDDDYHFSGNITGIAFTHSSALIVSSPGEISVVPKSGSIRKMEMVVPFDFGGAFAICPRDGKLLIAHEGHAHSRLCSLAVRSMHAFSGNVIGSSGISRSLLRQCQKSVFPGSFRAAWGIPNPRSVAVSITGIAFVAHGNEISIADKGHPNRQFINRACCRLRGDVTKPDFLHLDEKRGLLWFITGGSKPRIGHVPVPSRAQIMWPILRGYLLCQQRRATIRPADDVFVSMSALLTLELELSHDLFEISFPSCLSNDRLQIWRAFQLAADRVSLKTTLSEEEFAEVSQEIAVRGLSKFGEDLDTIFLRREKHLYGSAGFPFPFDMFCEDGPTEKAHPSDPFDVFDYPETREVVVFKVAHIDHMDPNGEEDVADGICQARRLMRHDALRRTMATPPGVLLAILSFAF